MKTTVLSLDGLSHDRYRALVDRCNDSMFTHTVKYHALLDETIGGKPRYVVATEGETFVGAVPLFLAESDRFGPVANSLPFFGSPGGFLVDSELSDEERKQIERVLFDAVDQFAERNGCLTATVISSQFDQQNEKSGNIRYEPYLSSGYHTKRLAQIVPLPQASGADVEDTPPAETPTDESALETVDEHLFYRFEKRCRRAIRKSCKEGVEVHTEAADFEPLYRMHRSGMEAKGGAVKPRSFFTKIPEHVPSDSYDLTYAMVDDDIIAGLLLFYHDDVVEYYTPAYEYEYRDHQATSMLIYEAMKDAIVDGYRYWNFGGTRPSQESLYRFKRGWGAVDYEYHYYTYLFDDDPELLNATPETLQQEYPWFYVVPFEELSH